jgi:hypothetical protein
MEKYEDSKLRKLLDLQEMELSNYAYIVAAKIIQKMNIEIK